MLIALFTGLLTLIAVLPAQAAGPDVPPPGAGQQPEATPRESGVRFVWDDRLSLRAGSWLRVDFRAEFQWDARRPGDHPPESFDRLRVQRARGGVEGEFLRHFRFNIERELTERDLERSATSPAWKDVYLEIDYTDAARVRVGKFKLPFGLDQTTGISNLDFIQRSLGATSLAPARDIGVMVRGRLFADRVNYWGGLFRQDGENARFRGTLGAGRTGALRVTLRPFRRPGASVLDQLELGSAVAVSAVANASELPNGLRGRTLVSRYLFFEPVFVTGRRRRVEVDLQWRWAPVGVRAEYTDVRDGREGQGLLGDDLPAARARAWYVSGAYVIGAARKTWPVRPQRELGRGGPGAIEIVVRYERLWFDSPGREAEAFRHPRAESILPNGDRALTWGVNWYASRWVRLQLHAVREQIDDLERHPRVDGSAYWNALFRLQCSL